MVMNIQTGTIFLSCRYRNTKRNRWGNLGLININQLVNIEQDMARFLSLRFINFVGGYLLQ